VVSPVVELRNVRAGYRDRLVLDGVSLTVSAGEWMAVIGPNGAGKSTLVKAMLGLTRLGGEVLIRGRDRRTLPARESARIIGYAPQQPAIPGGLTVTDYVLLGRTPHLGLLARERSADQRVVADVLRRLDLDKLAARRLGTLSGGERQRAVLARALAQQADVLLLDEPTTGLDLGHAQALLDLVDRLRREDGTTVVSTLHDLTLAGQYADRVLLLDGGETVAAGPPEEVLTPELLARHYDADVEVVTVAGRQVVIPVRTNGR
jgi:iron complex transport system ATP-binding protein